jgi:hypothetical protein
MLSRKSKLPESVSITPIKLDDEELDALLDEMDSVEMKPAVNHRRHERVPCRCPGVLVIINQQGYQSTFWIPVRDISKGGIAFLHRSMLHKGTPCTIRVRTPGQKWLEVPGKIVRSRYLRNMIYEVGLQFNREIDVEDFKLFHRRSRVKN